ncbi:MAG: succinylglutamate desuccinylase/aspartoacylase family protein, partial [Planctomycetaceae bacterium]|nr:succinylglutamate desuccinylase/aspartoacylase family protein [Planctomycetaceae bacterium]
MRYAQLACCPGNHGLSGMSHRPRGTHWFRVLMVLAVLGISQRSIPAVQNIAVENEDSRPSLSLSEWTLAEETVYETRVIVRDSGVSGPVVLLTGGIHGNEPAGAAAAEQIAKWPIHCGKLICVPRANVPALTAGTRYIPDVEKAVRDLNRNFHHEEGVVAPKGELAAHLWTLIDRYQPDWVVDLHEGIDFGRLNKNSVGSSVIASTTPAAEAMAELLISCVDQEIALADRKFMLRGPAVRGSLARAASEQSKSCSTLILETTVKGQSLALRSRQHRRMVATLLYRLDMISSPELANQFVFDVDRPRLNIALFDDVGVAGNGIPSLQSLWGDRNDVTIDRLCGADVRAGSLQQFDLFCCSGGSGSAQSRSLGEAGRAEVKKFVNDGGDYVGICAGSYLACSGFSWGLGILDAKTRSNLWRRGRSTLPVGFNDHGQQFFGTSSKELPVLYANGPVIEPHEQPGIEDFQVLAVFNEEVAGNETPVGLMKGTPAIVLGTFGKGEVL